MFPGGKGSRCIALATLPPSCADCLEIWEPQPPGQGLSRPVTGLLYIFMLLFLVRVVSQWYCQFASVYTHVTYRAATFCIFRVIFDNLSPSGPSFDEMPDKYFSQIPP